MQYISTRGQAPSVDFIGVLMKGLAPDGGLYLPEAWPQFSQEEIRAMRGQPYVDLACKIMAPYIGSEIPLNDFRKMVEDSYAQFDHPEVTPLREIGHGQYLQELFHGPTLAFKDVALQLVGRLFEHALPAGQNITVLGATSGDTGSAAIQGCRGRKGITTFILYPHLATSDVQRRQMTTVPDSNVHAIAIKGKTEDRGNFDDCQAMVKAMFGDKEFNAQYGLTAVNSINWARIMAQIVYYFDAALKLGAPDKKVSFVVPTGNFGDALAGYVAERMGLPIRKLVVATNSNDILHDFYLTGKMLAGKVVPTHSPSMDILVSSNFERLLFEKLGRDPEALSSKMRELKEKGSFDVSQPVLREMKGLFASASVNNFYTEGAIRDMYDSNEYLIEPHTAVGYDAMRRLICQGDVFGTEPIVVLSTAHPAKFPEVVKKCTGVHPSLPEHMADLFERSEHRPVLPNDIEAVRSYIQQHAVLR